jgi:hypothetical protein
MYRNLPAQLKQTHHHGGTEFKKKAQEYAAECKTWGTGNCRYKRLGTEVTDQKQLHHIHHVQVMKRSKKKDKKMMWCTASCTN